MKTLNKLSLALLEKLETPSGVRKLGYKSVRKIFDYSFKELTGIARTIILGNGATKSFLEFF